MTGRLRIEALAATHSRANFDSGSPALDRYLTAQASQDVKRRASSCYLAIDIDSEQIAGFYTLAAGSMPLMDLPAATVKKLPRYPAVPVARLGRLAVDRRFQGQQLGATLLWDAAQRAVRSELAVFAVVVDAKDETAAAFYRHHGFMAFANNPLQLFLPLASLTQSA